MTREQAINIAVGCVITSAMDRITKTQVIEVLRGIEKELDAKRAIDQLIEDNEWYCIQE